MVKIESLYVLNCEEEKKLLEDNFSVKPMICVCDDFALYLSSDGSVSYAGGRKDIDISKWKLIKKLCAGRKHIAALTYDGKVMAVGDNSFGQCDVEDWNFVSDIGTGAFCTVGVIGDGNKSFVTAGGFGDVSSGKTEKASGKSKKDTGYRIPGDGIENYGGMVDFTKEILGGK